MKRRIFFLLILGFWLVMNALLWRAEYSTRHHPGAPVAVSAVWERIRTSPDNSALEILHHGKKLGACRWVSTVTTVRPAEGAEGADPEGMIKSVTGYAIDFDGNLFLKEAARNLRFYFHLNLSTNNTWLDLHLRASLKPEIYEIFADAARQQVIIRLNDGEADSEFVYTFTELADPRRLLKDFEMPLPLEMLLPASPAPAPAASPAGANLGLQWTARNDTLNIGSSAVRVYRLQTQLLGRHQLVVLVSRAGEILRVELPGGLTLVNYALSAF